MAHPLGSAPSVFSSGLAFLCPTSAPEDEPEQQRGEQECEPSDEQPAQVGRGLNGSLFLNGLVEGRQFLSATRRVVALLGFLDRSLFRGLIVTWGDGKLRALRLRSGRLRR